jgi:hypothetical protein
MNNVKQEILLSAQSTIQEVKEITEGGLDALRLETVKRVEEKEIDTDNIIAHLKKRHDEMVT